MTTGTMQRSMGASTRGAALQRCKPRGFAPFCSPMTRRVPRKRAATPVRASLDAGATLALTQQAIAFAAVVGGEAAFTGLNTPEAAKGRPSIPTTLGGVGATVVAVILVQQGVDAVGCGLGFAASAYLFANYLQRTKDTVQTPEDWPGPKAWPAVMALISFFSLCAFFQALLASFK